MTPSWPTLLYSEFRSTSHLLHMLSQTIGKFKLLNPFEPQWANVSLALTSHGLTTGPIIFQNAYFAMDMDFLSHKVFINTSWGDSQEFAIYSSSVAELTQKLFDALKTLGINSPINTLPQEIPTPIPFEKDTEKRIYSPELATNWWQILLSSHRVLQHYHAKFAGKTQPLGFMWGTFDLRDVRYNGELIQSTEKDFIRRNAMDAALIECGWWSGNEAYPKPAYYSFTFPEPDKIAQSQVMPTAARWDNTMKLFLLDYDDLLNSLTPEKDLLAFFNSTYEAGAKLANWNKDLITAGKPK